MAYTTIDKPSDYFNTKLYTGNGGTQSITGVGFQPDWVWIKDRTVGFDHVLQDSVRGTTKIINSNQAYAEFTNSASITSFNSDGFTTGSYVATNNNNTPFVSWNWKAGTSFTNDASATGVGTLDSTGSSSQTAGFSIVSYTSNGSSSQSVAHNLGGVPEMIISKNRDSSSSSYNYWTIFNHNLATANDKKLILNTSAGASTTNEWGDTDPTSTVYSLHTSGDGTTNHSSDKIISYCFRGIKGYSKFGSYTGNGNTDGTFVYTGFKPAWVLCKTSSISGEDWIVSDNKRNPSNETTTALFPNTTSADQSSNSIDMLSNGFKMRTTGTYRNQSGVTYIYMAFAEAPFVNSSGVPNNAR